jgi:hypothetical protein
MSGIISSPTDSLASPEPIDGTKIDVINQLHYLHQL